MPEYEQRDTERLGDLYLWHVAAMTAEGLHDKNAIAAELAYRDRQISTLQLELLKAVESIRGIRSNVSVQEELPPDVHDKLYGPAKVLQRKEPYIIVVCEGGVVTGVFCSVDAKVDVLNHDEREENVSYEQRAQTLELEIESLVEVY